MSYLCFVQRFLTGLREVALAGEEGGRIGGIASNYVKKSLISKQTLGHFNKLDFTDTFE